MNSLSPSVVDSEESIFCDQSTAPTTPEGSLSFSPVLRPRNPEGTAEDGNSFAGRLWYNSRSLNSALADAAPRPVVVRNICCVGAGYVGGPTASVIAFQNPHIVVTVVDRDAGRIRRWNSRHPPIYEAGLEDIVRIARDGTHETTFLNEPAKSPATFLDTADAASLASTSSSECGSQCQCGDHRDSLISVPARKPNLFFSTDVAAGIAAADIVLIAVNTPTKSRGAGAGRATDMTAFEAVTAVVAQHARPGAIIVEKSTVPCRTAHLVQETMAIHRPGVSFEVLSNPEFLAAGTAVSDLMYPDRVLIGSSMTAAGKRAAEALAGIYASWVPRSRIKSINVWSSELAKLVANSMLAQRLSSINSIAAICEKTGADVDEVAASIGCDPRIGDKFLKAGIGFGGSCFKKDVLSLVYLARSFGLDEVADYWEQVIVMNEYSRDRFARRVVRCLNNTLAGKKIAVLGYAFKKNTSDTRESPALEIIKSLLEEGPREVAVFDPCCNPVLMRQELCTILKDVNHGKLLVEDGGPLAIYTTAYEACDGATAVLITTEFDEFKNTQNQVLAPEGLVVATTQAGHLSKAPLDPRPFERLEPTESELLALHKYLVGSVLVAQDTVGATNPLQRYMPEPACAVDCPDCQSEKSGYDPNSEYRPKERVDWAKVSYHMRKPKWLFDGKGVIDAREMTKLGLRVECVGR